MPRKLRINEPAFYHVISRGVVKRNVFLDRKRVSYLNDIMNSESFIG